MDLTRKWTNQEVYQLIEMFKQRELLWDVTSENYRDRNKKHVAWCEIADAFDVDRQVVDKKIKSLVGQFQRELKKASSDDESEDVSSWFAFKKLMFLRNRQTINTRNSGVKDKGDKKETQKEGDTHNEQKYFATPQNKTNRKRSSQTAEEDTSDEALNMLKRICGSSYARDEFDVFGEHVATKLRNLNNSCAKHTAQFHINTILYNAAMGEYDIPSLAPRVGYGSNTPSLSGQRLSINTPGTSSITQSGVDDSSQSFEDILNDIKEES